MLQGLHFWLSKHGQASPLVWIELQHEALQTPLITTPNGPLLNGMLINAEQEDGQILVASTIVEYAVETYGLDTLPTLMAGFRHYDSWQTLIPAVYGTSATQFERAWQGYVKTHYRNTP
jgi:hypothetical protein